MTVWDASLLSMMDIFCLSSSIATSLHSVRPALDLNGLNDEIMYMILQANFAL